MLLLERDHPIKKLYWDIPGGRLQKGESPLATLQREVKEEIGLENIDNADPFLTVLTDIRIPIQNDSVGLIFLIYRLNLSISFDPILSQEHIRFGWYTPHEAALKLKTQYPLEFIQKLHLLG